MHDFGWQCSPVERAGTEAPPYRDAAAAKAAARPTPLAQPVAAAKPASKTVPPRAAKPAAADRPRPAATGKPSRPKGLTGARGGKADNLQLISGVGPKLDKTLQGLGFYHFDQIAAWSKDEVDWVDEHLRFKGRIERDEWIPQAKLLAAGDMAAFNRKYGTGGLKDKSGKTRSGTRTRRS